MPIQELRVSSFHALHDALEPYRHSTHWIFRGQSDASWPLVPKAGRPEYRDTSDQGVFNSWRRRAVEHLSIPDGNDWDWLAVAQQHGLATRLLDWTANPLVAAYFAVETGGSKSAAIFVLRSPRKVPVQNVGPFEYKGVGIVRPRSVVPRLSRQSGVLTYHNPPDRPLELALANARALAGATLAKVTIAPSYRSTLLLELRQYGITRAALFPDLDGLSAHLNWMTTTGMKLMAIPPMED